MDRGDTTQGLGEPGGKGGFLLSPAARLHFSDFELGKPLRSCTRLNPLLGLDLGEEAS